MAAAPPPGGAKMPRGNPHTAHLATHAMTSQLYCFQDIGTRHLQVPRFVDPAEVPTEHELNVCQILRADKDFFQPEPSDSELSKVLRLAICNVRVLMDECPQIFRAYAKMLHLCHSEDPAVIAAGTLQTETKYREVAQYFLRNIVWQAANARIAADNRNAASIKQYHVCMFQLTCTLMHELAHFDFVPIGESGAIFEYYLFGGTAAYKIPEVQFDQYGALLIPEYAIQDAYIFKSNYVYYNVRPQVLPAIGMAYLFTHSQPDAFSKSRWLNSLQYCFPIPVDPTIIFVSPYFKNPTTKDFATEWGFYPFISPGGIRKLDPVSDKQAYDNYHIPPEDPYLLTIEYELPYTWDHMVPTMYTTTPHPSPRRRILKNTCTTDLVVYYITLHRYSLILEGF
ncbi:hypothetical protein DFH27DRAFT_523800 [Peziza echinospora]|nr:hypothetical protein DFH27DRAFT_523800 [Peziza echinospora]